MPKPSDWQHHKIEKPKDDNEYFEQMCRVIFMAGLNWRILENKWPGIKKAFDDFDIDKVAKYQEPEIDDLMNDTNVIRNLPKIRAIVANAKTIQEIREENGSFEKYLGNLSKQGEDTTRATVEKQFAFLGKGTTVLFLFSVGHKLPKAHAEWEARHK